MKDTLIANNIVSEVGAMQIDQNCLGYVFDSLILENTAIVSTSTVRANKALMVMFSNTHFRDNVSTQILITL